MDAHYRITEWKNMSLSLHLKDDGSAEVEFPGFMDSDFNQAGIIHIWKLSLVLEAGRWVGFRVLNLANLVSNLGQDRTLFSRQVDYRISPELYTSTAKSRTFPCKIVTRPLYAGKRSFALEIILCRVSDNVELVRSKLVYVWVNRHTRRPELLPDDVQQHFTKANVANQRRYEHPGIPAGSFVYEIEVQPSDTDRNRHTNQARYVRFCSDAALMAMAAGYYKGISSSPLRLQLQEMIVEYVKESLEGQRLKVHTWQEHLSPEVIYFTITRGGEHIFSCKWRLRLQTRSKL